MNKIELLEAIRAMHPQDIAWLRKALACDDMEHHIDDLESVDHQSELSLFEYKGMLNG